MYHYKIILSILCYLLVGSLLADDIGKAKKALGEKDFKKALKYTAEALKDNPNNPIAYYILSSVYIDRSFENYNIDLSYRYIIKADSLWVFLKEKTQQKFIEDGYNPELFLTQKSAIEKMGYDRAINIGTLQAVQDYIDFFQNSQQKGAAEKKRNELAFSKAEQENTIESYQYFIDTYPLAIQIPQAEKKYQTLFFYQITRDKKIESYKAFLKKYPNTEFTKECEKNIFEISTASNNIQDYINFINQYPKSHLIKKAKDFLASLDKNVYNLKYFSNYTQILSYKDSIQKLQRLENEFLLPISREGLYGIINENGKTIIPPYYTSLPPEYFSFPIQIPQYIEGWKKNNHYITLRNEKPITPEKNFIAENMGYGLIKIKLLEKYGVIHENAHTILPAIYQNVSVLHHTFIKIVENNKSGLATYSGKVIIPPQHDDIIYENGFWIFKQNEKYALASLDQITKTANLESINLSFAYDEIEPIHNNFLIAVNNDDTEILFDSTLTTIIQRDIQKISSLGKYFQIKQGKTYKIYSPEEKQYIQEEIQQIISNNDYILLKKQNKWGVIKKEYINNPTHFIYDSLTFFNPNTFLFYLPDTFGVIVENSITLKLHKDQTINFIGDFTKPYSKTNPEHFITFYYQPSITSTTTTNITPKKNTKTTKTPIKPKKDTLSKYPKIFDLSGTIYFSNNYENIQYLSKGYFMVEKTKKKGIVDKTGKIVVKLLYDDIVKIDTTSFISLIKDKKVGYYYTKKNIIIDPKYDQPIKKNRKLFTNIYKW